MALITDLITKKQRNRIDHSRVACFCDTSSANALAQCQAYYAAYPDLDANLIFQYDLSIAGAKDVATGWSLWVSDWADFLVDNNIEAVCCNPELDLDNPWGYTFNVSGARDRSFLQFLASGIMYKQYIQKYNLTGLPSFGLPAYPNLSGTPGVINNTYWDKMGGILDSPLSSGDNSLLPASITTGAGDNLYDYDVEGTVSDPQNALKGFFAFDWDVRVDYLTQPISMLPSWRIGWKSGSDNPAEITTAEITAMVERSIATVGSIESHIDDPIVSSSRKRNTQGFVGQAMAVDTIAKDMGFTDVKWGYSEKGGGVSALTTWNGKLNTDNYDPDETANTNVAFIENETAGTVGNTYRDISANYASGTYRWHAHNTNTFPMPAYIYIGSCLVNQDQQTNGSWCDAGSDAIFDIKDGAFLFEMTSHFLYVGGWAIKNGASGVFGSYEEPGTDQVDHGSAIMSNLLRGHQLATAVLFGQSIEPKSTELWGDGLAAPYYNESEEESNMNNVKFQLAAMTANVLYGAGASKLPTITNGGSGHSINDIVTLNGNAAGAGIKIKVATLGASDSIATFTWVNGGTGFANSEVLSQSNTTGSGIGFAATLPSNITTGTYPVGFGFFSEPLTETVGAGNIIYNNGGMEFAFSQFNPDIPDVHAIIAAPTLNAFFLPSGFAIYIEGIIGSWPYGDNLSVLINGTAYPLLESYFSDGSAVFTPGAAPGYSRAIWEDSVSVSNPFPISVFEGDNIGLSLTVPERQSSKSVISRSVISHNTES